MVLRKKPEQIVHMRAAGRVVAEMHELCAGAARPGATTLDLDKVARDVLERRNARSNFLGYHGFPAVACISPNEVIVHGIPDRRVLCEGDIVSIDCGAIVNGWHADAAITVPVGAIDEESQRLIDVTRTSLEAAIEQCRPDRRLGDVGAAVERIVKASQERWQLEFVLFDWDRLTKNETLARGTVALTGGTIAASYTTRSIWNTTKRSHSIAGPVPISRGISACRRDFTAPATFNRRSSCRTPPTRRRSCTCWPPARC